MSEASSAETLYALAAARSAARSMLADVAALGSHHLATAREAQAVFDAVRARALTLEKLEARHDETARSEDLHGEQILLDEMATTGWHRVRGGDARCP